MSALIRIFLGCALILSSAVAPPASAQTREQKAIIVLDASGSMWAQIEGKTKIEIAREVIGEIVRDWNPEVELGITAYGHRRKGDCRDIETIVPVGPVDAREIMSVVNTLKPKGKTPLGEAVRQAAEALRFVEDPATVILVSDGKETCDADPCAVAAELEEQGINFTVHVVGFDLTAEAAAQLQCVAANTGGRFLAASNASELRDAMVTTAQLVSEPAPEPEPAPEVPPGLHVTAVLAEGLAPLEGKVSYRVYETKTDLEGKRKQVEYSSSARTTFDLPAGRYLVVAFHGEATAEAEVELPRGEGVELRLVLNAGYLRASSVAAAGLEPLGEKVSYRVYEAKKDLEGKRKQIAYSSSAQTTFRLPAGRYVISAFFGSATVSTEVEVAAGALSDEVLNLNAGVLRARATASEGGAPLEQKVNYRVFAAKKDLEGKRRQIEFSSSPVATFRLSAGRYVIAAYYGEATARAEVEVSAGELTEETINLDAGNLTVVAVPSEGGQALSSGVNFRVYEAKKDLEGKRRQIDFSSSARTNFRLPAGRYVVAGKRGDARAEAEVEVSAGELTELELVLRLE